MQELAELLPRTKAEPRPYQSRIVEKKCSMYDGTYRNGAGELLRPHKSVLVESPTGSGKTIMMLLGAKLMQQRHGVSVGWCAMRRNLLAQAAAENRNKGINVEDMALISMFDKDPPKVDYLIMDEAQHDAAASACHIHARSAPRWIAGCTATPFRTDRMKLHFEGVVKDAGIHQLIQEGYLSPYHHYTIDNWNPETLADQYVAEPDRWGKSLFFFHKHEQAFSLQNEFGKRGFVADVVTADSDREKQLEQFTSGEVKILINCAILTEGFDCPDLKTVWVRPSGKGCTIQMGGRVFRKHADHPVKQIVQSKDTRHPFIKTALPKHQFVWQCDQWRTLEINENIGEVVNRVRAAVASVQVTLPQFMVDRQKKKGRPRRLTF